MDQGVPRPEHAPEIGSRCPRVSTFEGGIATARHRCPHQLAQPAQVQHAVDLDHVALPHRARVRPALEAQLPEQPLPQRLRHRPLDLDPHDGIHRAPAHRLLDRLEQVPGVFVGEIQLGRPGEPEQPGPFDPAVGVDQTKVVADHFLQEDEVVGVGHREKPGDPIRQAKVREVRRAGLPVVEYDRDERVEMRHDRNREPRAHGDRARVTSGKISR